MTIHSDALHLRAKAARAEAVLAAEKLLNALLEFVCTVNGPSHMAAGVVATINQLKSYQACSLKHSIGEDKAFAVGMASRSGIERDLLSDFHRADTAAHELTAAAQMLEFRATLP